MIYFTSDLHFWHKNAVLYTNRPFGTVEEMNEKLIEYWNSTVHKNDEVYILGDVTMGMGIDGWEAYTALSETADDRQE